MPESQTKLLTLMVAVLLGLVTLLVLGDSPQEHTPETQQWKAAFPEFSEALVEGVSIETPSQTVVLSRSDDGWRLEAPYDAPADPRRVDNLVRAVGTAQVGEPLSHGEDLTSFGLEDPAVVSLSGQGPTWSLRLGAEAPVGNRSYVQRGGEAVVRATRTALGDAVVADPDHYRDRAVIRVPTSAVVAITLDQRQLVRDDRGWWVRTRLGPLRADEERVRTFLRDVDNLRADEFPEGWPAEIEVLDRQEVSLTLAEGSTAQVVAEALPGGTWRLTGPLQPQGVLSSGPPLPGFEAQAGPWTATELLPVRSAQLSHVSIEAPGISWQSAQEAGQWSQEGTQAVLTAIAGARADRTRILEADRAANRAVAGHIRLTEDDTRVQEVILLASLETGDVPVRDTPDSPAYVVSAAVVEGIIAAARRP